MAKSKALMASMAVFLLGCSPNPLSTPAVEDREFANFTFSDATDATVDLSPMNLSPSPRPVEQKGYFGLSVTRHQDASESVTAVLAPSLSGAPGSVTYRNIEVKFLTSEVGAGLLPGGKDRVAFKEISRFEQKLWTSDGGMIQIDARDGGLLLVQLSALVFQLDASSGANTASGSFKMDGAFQIKKAAL